jgi:hypothetical protein
MNIPTINNTNEVSMNEMERTIKELEAITNVEPKTDDELNSMSWFDTVDYYNELHKEASFGYMESVA